MQGVEHLVLSFVMDAGSLLLPVPGLAQASAAFVGGILRFGHCRHLVCTQQKSGKAMAIVAWRQLSKHIVTMTLWLFRCGWKVSLLSASKE